MTPHPMQVRDADDIAPQRFDAAIVAASIHVGHYQQDVCDFAAANLPRLDAMPTLFLSVCLAAAGHDAEDWQDLEKIVAEFSEATGWVPGRVAHIAGAYMPSRYDVFRRFVMRRIVAAKDPTVDVTSDHEFTDWDALSALVADWLSDKA